MISIYNYKFPSKQYRTLHICCIVNVIHFKIFSSFFYDFFFESWVIRGYAV